MTLEVKFGQIPLVETFFFSQITSSISMSLQSMCRYSFLFFVVAVAVVFVDVVVAVVVFESL